MKTTVCLMTLCLSAAAANAENRAYLFGGGPNPENSQYSIEDNVVWFQQILNNGDYATVVTQFGSNQSQPAEIKSSLPVDDSRAYSALAEALGLSASNNFRYAPARIGSSNGLSNERDHVISALTELTESMQAGDHLLITYSGHGGQARNATDNFFYLWNNTQLSVTELDKVLELAPAQTEIQFVLPQCYSGAFNRLAYEQLDPASGLKNGPRVCGFTSVAEDRIAEGCTASVESGDYRDYASQLFAAATGRDRQGLPVNPVTDRDQDGHISLLEAHYAVYAQGNSSDIPRATSEDYLLSLVDWRQKFQSYQAIGADNVYMSLAASLAEDYENPPGSAGFLQEAAQRRNDAEDQWQSVYSQRKAILQKNESLRRTLQKQLYLRWPPLAEHATLNFVQTINTELETIETWLRSQPEYLQLISNVEQERQLVNQLIDADRDRARQLRISRALKLARMYQQLYRVGSDADRAAYEALLACENQPLAGY